jgi:hypothetical protein
MLFTIKKIYVKIILKIDTLAMFSVSSTLYLANGK